MWFLESKHSQAMAGASSYSFAKTLIPMASERAGSGRIKHCFLSGGGQR